LQLTRLPEINKSQAHRVSDNDIIKGLSMKEKLQLHSVDF